MMRLYGIWRRRSIELSPKYIFVFMSKLFIVCLPVSIFPAAKPRLPALLYSKNSGMESPNCTERMTLNFSS